MGLVGLGASKSLPHSAQSYLPLAAAMSDSSSSSDDEDLARFQAIAVSSETLAQDAAKNAEARGGSMPQVLMTHAWLVGMACLRKSRPAALTQQQPT